MVSVSWRRVFNAASWFLVLGAVSFSLWRIIGWNAGGQRVSSIIPELSSAVPALIQPGTTLDSQGLSLSAERSIILFMRTTCPFSSENIEFYRDVGEWAGSTADAQFVVVSDESPDAVAGWLDIHAIEARHVVSRPAARSDLYSLGVFATPTFATTNEHGVVTDIIVGALARPEEEQFLAMLSSGRSGLMNNLPDPPLVDNRTFMRLASYDDVRVLDVRARAEYRLDHDPQAMNIPADELGIRAVVELAASDRLFVDCRVGSLPDCRNAARDLVLDGFYHVGVIVP